MFIETFLASPFYSFRLILLLAARVLMFLLSIQHPIPPVFFCNPYAFPPIALIPQLTFFLRSLTLPCTLIIPDVYLRRFWWSLLRATATQYCLLAHKGDPEILSIPYSKGFFPQPRLPWDLSVLRI